MTSNRTIPPLLKSLKYTLQTTTTEQWLATVHSLYNNVKPPSWLPAGTDFHLFKSGVEPKWEDPKCEAGGKWTILVPKGNNAKQTIDKYWLHMVRLKYNTLENGTYMPAGPAEPHIGCVMSTEATLSLSVPTAIESSRP